MICFRIQLTSENDVDWSELPIDLDVDNDTQPTIETDIPDLFTGTYSAEIIYNVSFPSTQKNYRILGGMLSGQGYKLERKEYNIFAIYNGEILNVDKMYAVRNGFLNDGRFEVQLYNSQNWAKAATDKKINTIAISGTYLHGKGHIDNVNSFGPKYEDGGWAVRYPFILRNQIFENIGTFLGIPINYLDYYYVVPSDLTPYVSLLRVLKKGYNEIGWNFECPFLESDYGRRIWVDLCKDEFPHSDNRKPLLVENAFGFYGTSSLNRRYRMFINSNIDSWPDFIQSTVPTNDNWWFNNGFYNEPVIADYNISMIIKRISPTKEVFTGSVNIIVEQRPEATGGVHKLITKIPYFVSGGEETQVSIDLKELYINERDKLAIYIELVQDKITSKPHYIQVTNITLAETKLHRRFLNTRSLYTIQQLMYDDSLMELTKGVSHLIYGKIDVDGVKKTIRLLSPYDTVIGGESIEGYYTGETKVLNNIQKVDYVSEDVEKKRYLHLSFQDSKEKIVNDLYPDSEKQLAKYGLHGIFVDFGEKYEKEVESYKNVYFTPTFTPTKDNSLGNAIVNYETGSYVNKGRRIVFALGSIDMQPKGRDISRIKFWAKENPYINPFWAHQSFNEQEFEPLDGSTKFLHLSFSTMKKYPDYQDVYPNLYELFVKKYIQNLITSVSGTVWKYMSSAEFSLFDKRSLYFFNIKDKVTVCNVTKIEGFRPCENQIVGIEFSIGDNFIADPQTTSTPPENDRPYNPDNDFEILVDKIDCSYFITLNFL